MTCKTRNGTARTGGLNRGSVTTRPRRGSGSCPTAPPPGGFSPLESASRSSPIQPPSPRRRSTPPTRRRCDPGVRSELHARVRPARRSTTPTSRRRRESPRRPTRRPNTTTSRAPLPHPIVCRTPAGPALLNCGARSDKPPPTCTRRCTNFGHARRLSVPSTSSPRRTRKERRRPPDSCTSAATLNACGRALLRPLRQLFPA